MTENTNLLNETQEVNALPCRPSSHNGKSTQQLVIAFFTMLFGTFLAVIATPILALLITLPCCIWLIYILWFQFRSLRYGLRASGDSGNICADKMNQLLWTVFGLLAVNIFTAIALGAENKAINLVSTMECIIVAAMVWRVGQSIALGYSGELGRLGKLLRIVAIFNCGNIIPEVYSYTADGSSDSQMIMLGIMAICNLPSIVVGLMAGSTLDKLMRNGSELQDTTDEKEPPVNASADETLPIDSETASAPLPVHEPQIVNVDSEEEEFDNEAKIPPIRIEIQKDGIGYGWLFIGACFIIGTIAGMLLYTKAAKRSVSDNSVAQTITDDNTENIMDLRFTRPTTLKGYFIHEDDNWPLSLSFEPGDDDVPMKNIVYTNLSQNINIDMQYVDGELTNPSALYLIMLRGDDNGKEFTIFIDYDGNNGFRGTAKSGDYSLPVVLTDEQTSSPTMSPR